MDTLEDSGITRKKTNIMPLSEESKEEPLQYLTPENAIFQQNQFINPPYPD